MRFRAIRAIAIGAITFFAGLVWTVPSVAHSDLDTGIEVNVPIDPEGLRPPTSIAQKLAVPAYFMPTGETAPLWDKLTAASDDVRITVANPFNGPHDTVDPNYTKVIKAASAAGITVLGYVDTGYFGTTGHLTRLGATDPDAWLAQAQQDVNAWYELYGDAGIGGIFFDQVTSQCGDGNGFADRTALLTAYVKETHIDALSVTNQGIDMDECYRDTADILLSFEGDLETYLAWEPPAWTLKEDPDKFWHLVYATANAADMTQAIALSKARNAGYIYVTPGVMDNPWDILPADPYWAKQLDLLDPWRRDRTPPAKVQGLRWLERTSTSITVAWEPASLRHGVVAYDVYDDGLRVATSRSGVASATVRNLEADSRHVITVRARDAAGNVSPESGEVWVSTRDADRRRPQAPGGLAGIGSTPTSAWLTWVGAVDPDGTVAGYDVYQDGKRVLSLPGTAVSISLSGLKPATTYSFHLVTKDASGNVSPASQPVSVTTPAAPVVP